MKKLIFITVITFSISTMGYSQTLDRGAPAVCQDCEPCTGSYLICDSNHDAFWSDVASNCGPGTSIEIEFLEGC